MKRTIAKNILKLLGIIILSALGLYVLLDLLLDLLVVGLLIALWLWPSPPLTRAQIEEFGQLTLAENTEVLNVEYWAIAIDPAIVLELSFPCAEREAFFADMGHTENFSTTERSLTNQHVSLQWWNPDSIKDFESASYTEEYKFMSDVLVERGETGSCKAYVYNGHM